MSCFYCKEMKQKKLKIKLDVKFLFLVFKNSKKTLAQKLINNKGMFLIERMSIKLHSN